MKGKILQRAELYLQKEGEKAARHILHYSDFKKICAELKAGGSPDYLKYENRIFLRKENFPPEGKKIKEWPEKEPEYKVGPERVAYCVPLNANFQHIKDMGITGIQIYGIVWHSDEGKAFLDKANDFGLKVMYEAKGFIHDFLRGGKPWDKDGCRRVIEKFDSHPALWCWGLYNELDAGVEDPHAGISFEIQREVHDFFRSMTDKPLVACVRGGTVGWHTVDFSLLDIIFPDTYVFDGSGKMWELEPLEALEQVAKEEKDYFEENNLSIPSIFVFQVSDGVAVSAGNHDTKLCLGHIEEQFDVLKTYNVFSGGLALWAFSDGTFDPMRSGELRSEIRELFEKIENASGGR